MLNDTKALVVSDRMDAGALRFTDEQKRLILKTCFNGASEAEAAPLVAIAEARGLNPLTQECHFVKRGDKWAIQASIDYLRQKAEGSGDYAGQDEPQYEYNPDGSIKLARVLVYRKSVPGRPFAVGVARWDEYFQPHASMWKKMPHGQIAKCAEALALRKAFPSQLAKIYESAEMDQADGCMSTGPSFAPVINAPVRDLEPEIAALRVTLESCETEDDLKKAREKVSAFNKDVGSDVHTKFLREVYNTQKAKIAKSASIEQVTE